MQSLCTEPPSLWPPLRALPVILLAALVAPGLVQCGAWLMLLAGAPPRPVPLGTRVPAYESTFTVTDIRRAAAIGSLRAQGEFYIVGVTIEAPHGERPAFDPERVAEVRSWRGPGAGYPVSLAAIRALDGPQAIVPTRVLGQELHRRLVFDLPRDVAQPFLVFPATVSFDGALAQFAAGRLYRPERFNLRFD